MSTLLTRTTPADLAFRAAADYNLARLLIGAQERLLQVRYSTSAAIASEACGRVNMCCDHSPRTPYEVRVQCPICVPQRELQS